MAYFSEIQLPRFDAGDQLGTLKKLYNVVRELQEMLQFVLANLDGDNIEGYKEIFNRLEGADGAVSLLKQTAEEISAQVRRGAGQIADLIVRADGITQRVQDTEKGVGELKVTADGISQRVADNAGNITSLQTTASGLAGQVSDMEGNISSLHVTASGLKSQVSNMEGSVSSVEQTANRLSSRVTSMEGSLSTVQQTANSLTSTVSDLNGKYTSIKQTVDSIDLEGAVTFTDLEKKGKSTINGGNISTGNIDLESVALSNNYGSLTMGEGSTGRDTTRGARLNGPITTQGRFDYANYFFASDAAVRMSGEDEFGLNSFYVSPDEIHADIAVNVGSDERIKNNISYDVAERYGAFYRALKPARYRMNSSRSERFHTGFIAQQLRDALIESGLASQDLAALVQQNYDPAAEDGGSGQYSIRYGELVALNTAMVQQLLARVDALEAEVKHWKGAD